MNNKELVTGNYFDILKNGKCKNDYWNILDGGVNIILTLPSSVNEKEIEEVMSVYDKTTWGKYFLRPSKRHCVALNDKDVEKLYDQLKKYF